MVTRKIVILARGTRVTPAFSPSAFYAIGESNFFMHQGAFMRAAVFVCLGLFAGSLHAAYNAPENEYFVIAEVLEDAGPPAANVDESGWDGRIYEIDAAGLELYASNDGTFSRIDAVAAVESKTKCKPQSGMASWYGGSLNGSKTANGESFNTNALADMTAAHKTLPMGTRVRVTNRKNGRSVIVRINDRGPFVHGRVIDISHAAAKALHLDGVGPVQLNCI